MKGTTTVERTESTITITARAKGKAVAQHSFDAGERNRSCDIVKRFQDLTPTLEVNGPNSSRKCWIQESKQPEARLVRVLL